MLSIRPLTGDDAETWGRMRSALWPTSVDLDHEIREFLVGNDPHLAVVFVADLGSGPIGFVEISLRSYAEGCTATPVPYIEGWWVDPPHRGRGIGRELVAVVERWAQDQGFREIASDARVGDEHSHRAHRALGFREIERVVCYRKELDGTTARVGPPNAG